MIKTITKTTYICDRCKKEISAPHIVKGSVEKQTQNSYKFEFHFCHSCLGEITAALSTNLTISGNPAGKQT